jgi:hypothetical protein
MTKNFKRSQSGSSTKRGIKTRYASFLPISRLAPGEVHPLKEGLSRHHSAPSVVAAFSPRAGHPLKEGLHNNSTNSKELTLASVLLPNIYYKLN